MGGGMVAVFGVKLPRRDVRGRHPGRSLVCRTRCTLLAICWHCSGRAIFNRVFCQWRHPRGCEPDDWGRVFVHVARGSHPRPDRRHHLWRHSVATVLRPRVLPSPSIDVSFESRVRATHAQRTRWRGARSVGVCREWRARRCALLSRCPRWFPQRHGSTLPFCSCDFVQ